MANDVSILGKIERESMELERGTWRKVPLDDVIDLVLSSVDKKTKDNERAVQLCNYTDVYYNSFIHAHLDFMMATATDREIAKCSLFSGDVVITKDSEKHDDIGVPALVRQDIPGLVCGYHLAILRPMPSKIEGNYLFYALCTSEVQHQFHSYANGITRFGLRKADIGLVEIPLPPLPEQRAIAHILGTLDDKIELNRRENETLEEMGRALFKSWFVDFDPVHAKAALKQPHSTPPFITGSRRASAPVGGLRRQYTRQTLQKARALRQAQTDAEGLLWHYLRGKRLGGYKFRRQQPIGPYIVDFACLSRKLLIEVDGGYHVQRKDYDERRDRFLRNEGYRVLRFWNNEVFEDCFGVLERVYAALEGPPPPPGAATPPRGGSDGGGEGEQGRGWTRERARAYLDKMEPSIAGLFPDHFVDSELGEIPAGWAVKALGELIELAYGKALKANDRKNGSIPVYGSNGQVGWHDKKLAAGPGIIVGRKGNPGIVTWAHSDFFPIDTTFYVIPRDTDGDLPFLFFALTAQDLPSVAADSAVPGLNRNLAYMNRQLVPNKLVVEEFNRYVSEIFTRSHRLEEESRTLAALRDALLPKLISGEIRVNTQGAVSEAIGEHQ